MRFPFGYTPAMEKKPRCPFTPEELEDSDAGMLARYRKRIREHHPETMENIARGKALFMATVIPPDVWATDPSITGKQVEGPTMIMPPVPDSDLPE